MRSKRETSNLYSEIIRPVPEVNDSSNNNCNGSSSVGSRGSRTAAIDYRKHRNNEENSQQSNPQQSGHSELHFKHITRVGSNFRAGGRCVNKSSPYRSTSDYFGYIKHDQTLNRFFSPSVHDSGFSKSKCTNSKSDSNFNASNTDISGNTQGITHWDTRSPLLHSTRLCNDGLKLVNKSVPLNEPPCVSKSTCGKPPSITEANPCSFCRHKILLDTPVDKNPISSSINNSVKYLKIVDHKINELSTHPKFLISGSKFQAGREQFYLPPKFVMKFSLDDSVLYLNGPKINSEYTLLPHKPPTSLIYNTLKNSNCHSKPFFDDYHIDYRFYEYKKDHASSIIRYRFEPLNSSFFLRRRPPVYIFFTP